MPRGAISQLTTSTRRRPAVPGMVADVSQDSEHDVLINSDPQADELYTLVIDTATDDEDYGVNLTDPSLVSITIDSGTGSTTTTVAAAIAAAWNAAPQARGIAVAVAVTTTVTFTAVYPGVAFVMEEDENAGKMTLTNTTDAAEADTVPFGRAMISVAYQADEADQLGILAKSSSLVAQVDTFTVIFEATEVYLIDITIEGQAYKVHVPANTNSDTTATDIRTAVNAIMPANSVIASGATDQVILTSELAGKGFVTDYGTQLSPDVNLVKDSSTNGVTTDFDQAFAGISTFSADTQQLAIDTESAEYAANAGVDVLQRGKIWVENTESISLGDAVYVELGVTADNGKFFAAASATRHRVDPKLLKWRRADHGASGAWSASDANVAMLSVSLAA